MAVVPTAGIGATGTFGPLAVVAVWEWKNEFNCWIPYSGKVSCYIEQCMQAHQKGYRAALGNASSICLGQVDSRLAPYIIDIPNMVQFRQDTGTVRDVQKTLYPLNSAPGCGVYWEWMTDEGSWTAYEMAVSDFLEKCLAARQQVADLGCLGYNYNIDLNYLIQTNKISGFQRKIHRCVDIPYPVIPTAGPVHKAATCSCQQCLVSGGVGPIPSRFRHSMSNQLNSFTSHSSSQSPPAASSVPYPKPSLSGTKARFSTNSPWPPSALPPVTGTVPSNGFSSLSLSLQLQRQNKVNQALAGMTSILLSAAGLPSRLSHVPPSASTATKMRSSVKKLRKMPKKDAISDPEQIMKKYLDKMDSPPDEDCIICMEKLTVASGYGDMTQSKTIQPEMVGKLKKCSHAFHMLCLLAMYNNGNKDGSLQCPSCKAIYGEKTGTQPNGKMDVYSLPHSLPGHPDCGTIQIAYTILPGTQGPEHPNPGKPYTARGFPRYCFLPDNRKGRKVLDLLRLAWKRRLIFTVGVSSTTGEVDTVVWNEIHHKTEMGSNKSGHGFPDPNYLDNVLAELAAQGVSEDCLGH